jgi:hypothetical protein
MENKKFRAICIHGLSVTQIWRGPIRADKNLAEIDLSEHSVNCQFNDSSIIQEGHPLWD